MRPKAEKYSGWVSVFLHQLIHSFIHATRTERSCPVSLYDDGVVAPHFWVQIETLYFLAVGLRSLLRLFLSVISSVKWAVRSK